MGFPRLDQQQVAGCKLELPPVDDGQTPAGHDEEPLIGAGVPVVRPPVLSPGESTMRAPSDRLVWASTLKFPETFSRSSFLIARPI